jgi:hypothetical protein
VKRLIAGFPQLNAHDPIGYVEALVDVMSGYPLWAGQRVIVRVDEEKPEFAPSDRVLRSWLDDAVRPWRFAMDWEKAAAKQLKEREELQREGKKEQAQIEPRGTIFTNYDEAVAPHGRPFGPFEPSRQLPYRGSK